MFYLYQSDAGEKNEVVFSLVSCCRRKQAVYKMHISQMQDSASCCLVPVVPAVRHLYGEGGQGVRRKKEERVE